ncbi:hypothetical protein AAFF_G00007180 [Aldrovandia affinis]|uniref:Uncharacterized protein n=1 Tax=Aldrovandia affinis TaxID=143900 RepID=A0AAD7WZR7_9TELE|nr:hypothetical protein AAFF_G00007180 [Aldrovandia affinis]
MGVGESAGRAGWRDQAREVTRATYPFGIRPVFTPASVRCDTSRGSLGRAKGGSACLGLAGAGSHSGRARRVAPPGEPGPSARVNSADEWDSRCSVT